MNYTLTLNGFEGQVIEVQGGSAFAGPKLLVNGQPAPKGQKRGEMLLRRSDGTEVTAKWKPVFKGWDTPQLDVGGQTITIVEPLKWYEWVWSALPLLLIFVGGLLGALAGAIAVTVNTKIFRTSLHVALRYALTALVSLVAVVAYVVAATLFLSAVGG
jgi:hypothetical protein